MRRSWRWGWALLVVASAGTAAIGLPLGPSSANGPITAPAANQAQINQPSQPTPAGGGDPVGALFARDGDQLGPHFCTASVVSSRSGDLLITAAHCVWGIDLRHPGRLLFAPGYAGGRFPRGLWVVTRRFTDSRWSESRDPDDDVAFLVVRPVAKADGLDSPVPLQAPGATVRGRAGANRLRFGAQLPVPVTAIGYPDSSDRRVSCSTRAVAFDSGSLHQVRFACPGFTDGTSGGPLISGFNPAKHTGAIIGVVGGYQQGGDSPGISYSSAFAANIRALYHRAVMNTRLEGTGATPPVRAGCATPAPATYRPAQRSLAASVSHRCCTFPGSNSSGADLLLFLPRKLRHRCGTDAVRQRNRPPRAPRQQTRPQNPDKRPDLTPHQADLG